MKRVTIVLSLVLLSTLATYSQTWGTSNDDIYYNLGKVSIGTTDFQTGFDFNVSNILRVRNVSNLSPVSIGVGINGFLDVKRNSSIKAARISQQGTGNILELGTTTDGTAATFIETCVFSSSGNIGVGNISPNYKLDIDGNINLSSGNNFLIDGEPAFTDNPFWTASESNIFYNTGAVNIGITEAEEGILFDVGNILRVRNVSNLSPASIGVGINGFLDVKRNSSIKAARISQQGTGNILELGTTTDGTAATFIETCVFSSSGNIGVGNISPNYKLDIDGNINLSSGNNFLIDGEPAFTDNPFWTASESNIFYNTGAVNIGITEAEEGILFDVGNILRVRNVSNSSPASIGVGINGFLDVKRNSSIKAARISQQGTGNILELGTTTDGTAATFNETCVFSSSGNIGIGENMPEEKLEVNGNILIKNNNALILTSPNGTAFEITVDDSGNLTTNQTTNTNSVSVEMAVDVYPNPANDFITVSLNEKSISEVNAEIYDLNGKMIFMRNYKTLSFQILLDNFEIGTFLLKLLDSKGNLIKTEKIIKQ